MKSKVIIGAALAALLFACIDSTAQTNVYRWTDKDGKVHFSDTPPPADASSTSQKRMGGGYVESDNLPYATQIAARRHPVTLYIGGECGAPCTQGRDLLSKRGIPFMERDAGASAADGEALKKLIGSLEVPTLVVGEGKIKGYEEGQWQGALDGAGYPRTRLPGQAAGVRSVPKAAEAAKAPAAPEGGAKPQ